jgi:hypothetical protein
LGAFQGRGATHLHLFETMKGINGSLFARVFLLVEPHQPIDKYISLIKCPYLHPGIAIYFHSAVPARIVNDLAHRWKPFSGPNRHGAGCYDLIFWQQYNGKLGCRFFVIQVLHCWKSRRLLKVFELHLLNKDKKHFDSIFAFSIAQCPRMPK